MTEQVEIAKKILEQGNCYAIGCGVFSDNCPFHIINIKCEVADERSIANREYIVQWLKEQEKEMIDLTVNQIVEPPVECWVKNSIGHEYHKATLHSIDHRYKHTPFRCGLYEYKYCTLTDPTKPKFKPWLILEDVPVGLWGKALVKFKNQNIRYARTISPCVVSDNIGNIHKDLVYLPLGQPLTGEWLEMGEWVWQLNNL